MKPKAIVIRPSKRNHTLQADLLKLSKKDEFVSFNKYVETVLVRHVRRMSINQDTK